MKSCKTVGPASKPSDGFKTVTLVPNIYMYLLAGSPAGISAAGR